MTQSKAPRTIIDTHRLIFGPKLRQKLIENVGFDDSKPFPQVLGDEMSCRFLQLQLECFRLELMRTYQDRGSSRI